MKIFWLILLFIANAQALYDDKVCCNKQNNLQKAISSSDFSQVQQIFSMPELLPLFISRNGYHETAKEIRLKREIELHKKQLNWKKVGSGLVLIWLGFLNAVSIPALIDQDQGELAAVSGATSLGAMCSGGYFVVDGITRSQSNLLANAIAIEQLIKEKMPS